MVFSLVQIIRVHTGCLKDNFNPAWKSGVIFLGLPALISGGLIWQDVFASSQFISVTIPMLSILVGFSINAVTMLIDSPEGKGEEYNELLFQTRSHTLFAIVFGLGLLVICGSGFLLLGSAAIPENKLLTASISFIIFFGLIHYILTLYLLPARIYALIQPADQYQQ